MTQEDDNTWTQTLITVTPEDDAVLREIANTALLSADARTQLELNPENIIHRRPLNYKHIVDPREFEEEPTRDAQNQTYLQGISFVNVPVQYKDEAVQTMYMSTPCAPFRHFKEIMTSLNESPMPILKKNNFAQTILTYVADTEQQVVIEGLLANIEEEDHEKSVFTLTEKEEAEIAAGEILSFILDRAFWISDPSSRLHARLTNEETQTSIRYNYSTNKVVLDGETQTGLTCEPKQSNTKLLSDYQEIKEFARNCIENCVLMAVDCRALVDEIIDELIDKSAERIKYPMKAQETQTLASYRLSGEKDEEVLRKLKLDVIVDPFESSIVVIPLIDNMLLNVCEKVSVNAQAAVKNIIKIILQRVAVIIVKLLEIRRESQPKPMDHIFDQRRKKIVESMARKETESISTQTRIAGVPEVTKIREPKEVVCCTACRRHSACHWCIAAQEGGDVPEQEYKILRTQDILLAYKPCYVVATASEQMKNPVLRQTFTPEKIKTPPLPPLRYSEESSRASSEAVSIVLRPRGRVKARDSSSGWSFIIDTALTEPWSAHGGSSNSGRDTSGSSEESELQSTCKRSLTSHSGLALEAEKALQILKSTFCTRETCTALSLKNLKEGQSECIKSTCSGGSCSIRSDTTKTEICTKKRREHCTRQSGAYVPSKVYPIRAVGPCNRRTVVKRSQCQVSPIKHIDGFKVIPVCASSDSDS